MRLQVAGVDLRVQGKANGLQAEDLPKQETASDLNLQAAVADLHVQEKTDGLEVMGMQKQVPAED